MSDLPQDGRTLQVVERPPAILVGLRAGHRLLDVVFDGLPVPAHHDARPGRIDGFHDLSVAGHQVAGNVQWDLRRMFGRLTFPVGDKFLGPPRVLHQREVRVRLVLELLPGVIGRHRRGRGLTPILRAARRIRDGCIAWYDSTNLASSRCQSRLPTSSLNACRRKLSGPGVLIQSPHEVADRVDEIFAPTGRGIQQQSLADLEQCAPLMIGHSLEHFELHVLECVFSIAWIRANETSNRLCEAMPRRTARRFSGWNPSTSIRLKFASVSSFDL